MSTNDHTALSLVADLRAALGDPRGRYARIRSA